MRRTHRAAAFAASGAATGLSLFLLAAAGPASAGEASDALGRCLVRVATPADNEVLARWIFSAITENPKLAPLAAVTPEQRETFDRSAAELFQRLLLKDCRKESIVALQQDGTSAIAHSFELLGSVAARQLMTDPQVVGGMQHMTRFLDPGQWRDFAAEAGPGPAAAPAAPQPPPK